MSAPSSRSLPGAAAALITIVFWGSAFAGIRAGLHSYSPAHRALLRYLFASAACAVIVARPGMHRPMLRDIPLVALLGLLGFAFSNIALNVGEQSIPSGPAAIIFLGERLQAWGWIGIAVSFGGALVIALGKGSG